ncbi:MAG TPA: hypothetical protein VF759_06020 [Allosphingosinicella sp.]|jgi:hypothetical protein
MAVNLEDQLRDWLGTLRIVSNATGPVRPGQRVDLSILSSAREMSGGEALLLPAVQNVLGSAGRALSQAPVRVKVKWEVEREKGEDQFETLVPGTDFLANAHTLDAEGLQGAAISLTFMPEFVPLTEDSPTPTRVTITPTVTLEAILIDGAAATHARATFPMAGTPRSRNPLRLDLDLLPLQVPVFLALFRFNDYRPLADDLNPGFALLITGKGSPLKGFTEATNEILVQLEESIRPLRSIAGVAGFLTGLATLRHALAAQPTVRVASGDVENLAAIHMRKDSFLGVDALDRDLRAHDETGSLILIGPSGTTAGCFCDEEFEQGEGAFEVRTGAEAIRLVPSVGALRMATPTPGVTVLKDDTEDTFDDSLSSITIANPALA